MTSFFIFLWGIVSFALIVTSFYWLVKFAVCIMAEPWKEELSFSTFTQVFTHPLKKHYPYLLKSSAFLLGGLGLGALLWLTLPDVDTEWEKSAQSDTFRSQLKDWYNGSSYSESWSFTSEGRCNSAIYIALSNYDIMASGCKGDQSTSLTVTRSH